MNEQQLISKARELARQSLWSRPGIGSPDGQCLHDEGVAIRALLDCGATRPMYKGVKLPWSNHKMFATARAAVFRVALDKST